MSTFYNGDDLCGYENTWKSHSVRRPTMVRVFNVEILYIYMCSYRVHLVSKYYY